MLDNPEEMLGVEHTGLKKPCRTTCPARVTTTTTALWQGRQGSFVLALHGSDSVMGMAPAQTPTCGGYSWPSVGRVILHSPWIRIRRRGEWGVRLDLLLLALSTAQRPQPAYPRRHTHERKRISRTRRGYPSGGCVGRSTKTSATRSAPAPLAVCSARNLFIYLTSRPATQSAS